MNFLFKTFCIMVIFTMFVDMTALSNNITNRDGLWRVDSDSVTITTSYSEKQPEKLNVCIYNHSNSTIYIGRTYGLLMQVDGEWKYIAKGRNQKCITIWPCMTAMAFLLTKWTLISKFLVILFGIWLTD